MSWQGIQIDDFYLVTTKKKTSTIGEDTIM